MGGRSSKHDASESAPLTTSSALVKPEHLTVIIPTLVYDAFSAHPDTAPSTTWTWDYLERHGIVHGLTKGAKQLAAVQNEAAHVEHAIQSTAVPNASRQPQIIVADGGSNDETISLVSKTRGVEVLQTGRGRGLQMDAGVSRASGEWLLFLHADCQLPRDYFEGLASAINARRDSEPSVPLHRAWGCFSSIDTGLPSMSWVEWGVRMRTACLSRPYGDQGLFCHRQAYQESQGFKHWPFLEDVDWVVRLRRRFGPPIILPMAMHTSPRRWEHLGILKTTAINQVILAGHAMGVPVDILHRLYSDLRHKYVNKG